MAVDATVEITLLYELSEQICMCSLASTHYWAPNGHCMAFHLPEDVVDNFLYGPTRNFLSAFWAVWFSNSGPKQSEVILNFSYRCNG